MSDFIPQESPFTGRKMLLIIISFFAVIIAVNGTMLTLAVKTFGGLVVGNSYVASQNFNADIATAQAQPIRGWSLDITARDGLVTVTALDRDGTALNGLNLSLTIARPTHGRSTVIVPLSEQAAGIYSGTATLESGQWLGTLTTADGQTRSLTFSHARPAL